MAFSFVQSLKNFKPDFSDRLKPFLEKLPFQNNKVNPVVFYQEHVSTRAFVWTIGLLTVLTFFALHNLHLSNSTHSDSDHEAETHPTISGKIMASLDLIEHADQPIQYGVEDMHASPLDQHDLESGHKANLSLDKKSSQFASGPRTKNISALFESTPFGDVPIKNTSNPEEPKSIFDGYRIPFTAKENTKALIALVMVDFGLSEEISRDAVFDLPDYTSFAISPYTRSIQSKIDGARSYNHEVWLEAPIQPENFGLDDTGPLTLLSGLNSDQNTSRLLRLLSLGKGYVGISFINKPDFKDAELGLENIFSTLDRRGIALVAAQPDDALSQTQAIMFKTLPFASADIWLNDSSGHGDLLQALSAIENKALNDSAMIVYMQAHPKIFPVLSEWSKKLPEKQIEIAPLSAVLEYK